jgi:Carboxypeptidase regulatory-like domain
MRQNQPVREATITLTDSTEGPNSVGSPVTTGGDGRFTFALVEGGKYELRARCYVGTDVRTRELQMTMTPLKVSSATPFVTLVMKPNKF